MTPPPPPSDVMPIRRAHRAAVLSKLLLQSGRLLPEDHRVPRRLAIKIMPSPQSSLVRVGRRRVTFHGAFDYQEFFRPRVVVPSRDFLDCAPATATQPTRFVDGANVGTRRGNVFIHHAAPCFAVSARAVRDDVLWPRCLHMNSPTAISFIISTPVSMPRPSSM